MKYKVVYLVLLFSVLLVGVSFAQNSYAVTHAFELEWGSAGTKSGMFLHPQQIAIDSENNVFVTDRDNSRIQKFDDQGNYITSWKLQNSEPDEIGDPSGIAVSDGFVFVADSQYETIQKFDTDGNFVLKWGNAGSGNGEFRVPNGITISDDKFVYIVDTGNSRIQKFTFDGEYVSHFGQSGKRAGNLVSPLDIAIGEAGNLFVTDPGNHRINIYTEDGKLVRAIDSGVGGFRISPSGIIIDQNNNLYIADERNNRIIQFNEFGFSYSIFGKFGFGEGQFQLPKDVSIDNDGYLYVVDGLSHRVQKFVTPLVSEQLIIEKEKIAKEPQIEQVEPSPEPEETIEEEIELEPVQPIPNDFKRPIISVPEDMIVEAEGGITSVNIGNAVASDESGILSLSNNAADEFPLGVSTVIWTAIDGSGNMAIATQLITIQDTTPPYIEQLKDIAFEAVSDTQNRVELQTPSTFDEVGIISIHNDAPDVFPLGETIVTWTVTDVMQNLSTMQQKITLVDSTLPRVDIPEDIITEATSINENKISLVEPKVFDTVKIESLSNDAPEFFPLGETIVTWTVTDIAGNAATSSHKVIVMDSISPEILVSDITLEATIPSGNDIELSTPKINDVQEVNITNDAPDVFPLGETIVTWTVTDQSGNMSNEIQNVSVVDTTKPNLEVPNDVEIEASGIETVIDDLGDSIAEDKIGISSITNDAPEFFPLGETIVTWTATDTSGNSVSDTQLVSVVDTTGPQIIAPSSINLEAVDPLENYIELSGGRVFDIVDISSITNDAPEFFPLGETIVTWTATDTSGNSVSDTQSIIIEDTIKPLITGPENITLEITDVSGMTVDIGNAFALDQVDRNPKITNDAPELFQLGNTIITWIATDSSDNSSLFFQTVTIIDTAAPEMIPPNNIIQEAENISSNSITLGNPETSDIVDISSITNDAPEFFPLGETIVTWTATDTSGNSVSDTQLVSVVDTTAPGITIPESLIIEATSEYENTVILENSIAEDKIGISSITNDAPEFFPLGETIVTWTATDTSGNSVSDTQLVSVVDTTAPSIETLENTVFEASGLQDNIVELDMIIANDNVGVVSIINDAPETFEFGLTTVNWMVSDNAGNTETIQQQVSLIDTTIPSITPPNDVKTEAVSNNSNIVEIGIAISSDNIQLKEITNDAPEFFPLGETIVTWTATDTSGNSVSDTQLVSVVDTTGPSILELEDIIQDATSVADNKVELVKPIADDAISEIVITNNAPDVFPFGETVVTWNVEDQSGNVSHIDQKIVIIDNTPPVLQASTSVIIDAIELESDVELIPPQISDIIDMQPIITNDAPEFFPLGETIVTWTATDTSGNSVSDTQLVSVQICGNSPSYYNFIIGTAENDFLTGTGLPDVIFAYGGDDIIIGNNGNDCIFAGEGNDIIFGNSGDDNITSGQGNDVVKGNSGADILKGGIGLDMIDGGDDIDTCIIVEEENSDLVIKCEKTE